MAYISEEEGSKFVRYANRGKNLLKKLNELSQKKELSKRDSLIRDEIERELNNINDWFDRTAKYD